MQTVLILSLQQLHGHFLPRQLLHVRVPGQRNPGNKAQHLSAQEQPNPEQRKESKYSSESHGEQTVNVRGHEVSEYKTKSALRWQEFKFRENANS